MKWLIDIGAKISGLNWIWAKVDGYKTRIAAFASILTGLAGLVNELLVVAEKHSFGALLEWAKSLPQDQSWLLVVGGLGIIGLGHKLDKAAANGPEKPS